MNKFLKSLLLVFVILISIILALLICNLVLEKINYSKPSNFYDFALKLENPAFTYDSDLIYRFSDLSYYRNYSADTLPSNTAKVVMIGDSVTWSYGATDDFHTYPQLLESNYNQSFPKNPIKVYNFGVPGYGLDQEYLLLQKNILPVLKPQLIIWNLNENDLWDTNYMCLFRQHNNNWSPVSAKYNIGYWYSFLHRYLPSQIINSDIFNFLWQKMYLSLNYPTSEPLHTLFCSQSLADSNKSLDHLKYFISQLQNQLSNKQTKLIFTLVPYQKFFQPLIFTNELSSDYLLLNQYLSSQNSFPYLNFNQAVFSKTSSSLHPDQDYFLDSSIDKNPDGIRHPNQKMYTLMSQSLLDFISTKKLFSQN